MTKIFCKKGFTFIELLIAVSLFTVGMISVLQVFPVNRKLLRQSGQTTQAVFLAQEQIEKVSAVPYADLTVGNYEPRAVVSSDQSTKISLFERKTVVNLVDSDYQNSNVDIGLKRVEVTIYWSENNQERSYSLATVAYNK